MSEGQCTTGAERDALVKRLEELDPSDDYHAGEVTPLDAHSYYAAIDRAVKIVTGELADWTDLGKARATPPEGSNA